MLRAFVLIRFELILCRRTEGLLVILFAAPLLFCALLLRRPEWAPCSARLWIVLVTGVMHPLLTGSDRADRFYRILPAPPLLTAILRDAAAALFITPIVYTGLFLIPFSLHMGLFRQPPVQELTFYAGTLLLLMALSKLPLRSLGLSALLPGAGLGAALAADMLFGWRVLPFLLLVYSVSLLSTKWEFTHYASTGD